MRRLFGGIILGISLLWAGPWLNGTVIKISDGDTFIIETQGKKQKIRLYGIDCPERDQDFGYEARRATDSLISGKTVRIQIVDVDRYDRIVGEVWINDTLNLNRWLIAHGYAWWYARYAKNRSDFHNLEIQARREKRGLWKAQTPVPPWEWRKTAR